MSQIIRFTEHGAEDFDYRERTDPRIWERIKALLRDARGARGTWQRRYGEHLIRDEADYRAHMDCVPINPLKHGLVTRVADWPFSTFHRLVADGVYSTNWAGGFEAGVRYDD